MKPPRILFTRRFTTNAADRLSIGFSGAGFLGCYHVGVAACLNKHGMIPHPDDDTNKMPLLTGVSAGSMNAAAACAGVNPEPDGMEVVLEAARRTRELSTRQKQVSLDVLTPGFSLIDAVEEPFRDAIVKSLGGYCEKDSSNNIIIHDIDPDLFSKRFPSGALRIGIADRRELWSPPLLKAYRYVDTFRDVEDIVACCMLSSYVPGITGHAPPSFLDGLTGSVDKSSSAAGRAGVRVKEMAKFGLVRHGKTGLPVVENVEETTNSEESKEDTSTEPTLYWDGGLAEMFPTFDNNTVIVSPLNGLYDPNPSISPGVLDDAKFTDKSGGDTQQQQHPSQSTALLQNLLRPYLTSLLPATFRHCHKSELGLNTKNAQTALKMIFSSDDDELYSRFKEGYDDAR